MIDQIIFNTKINTRKKGQEKLRRVKMNMTLGYKAARNSFIAGSILYSAGNWLKEF